MEWEGCITDKIKNPYMYVLEVSKDGKEWQVVIDHSICKCYSTQELYFPRHAARYWNTQQDWYTSMAVWFCSWWI